MAFFCSILSHVLFYDKLEFWTKITSFEFRCFIIYLSASYLEEDEEFFSSVEKSWQIESYSEFESEWTKVDKESEEPEMLDEVPDMTCPSDILKYCSCSY